MSSASSSNLLTESLAAAAQIIVDIERLSRSEVAQRDEILKDLRASQIETQLAKAALGQAELTIAHQTDTMGHQAETIAQQRRELAQWKDQSKNWQDHFLRVEQERCTLSSRMDELVSERLHWSRGATSSNATHGTPQSRYINSINLAPSSTTTKRASLPSPTHPQSYISATMITPSERDQESLDVPTAEQGVSKRRKNAPPIKTSPNKTRAVNGQADLTPYTATEMSSSGKLKSKKALQSAREAVATELETPTITSDNKATVRQSTVIRRVHAVIHVKREGSDESIEESTNLPPLKFEPKNEGSAELTVTRRRSRRIVEDTEEWSSQDETSSRQSRRGIVYPQSQSPEVDEEGEEDELMMVPEVCNTQDEVPTTSTLATSRNNHKLPPIREPPKKKRKVQSSKGT